MDAKRVINGNYGQIWIDGELIAETESFQAKITQTRTDVNFLGDLWKKSKLIGLEGKGSMKLHKVYSRTIRKVTNNLVKGKDTVMTIIAKLDDPDAWGSERIQLNNVVYEELTLMDWEVKKNAEETIPFQFAGINVLDTIKVQ